MKRLHKKIGVGVLVAGLLVGGISFSSGSVSYASSNNSEFSLFDELIDVYQKLGIKLPPELEAYSKGGHKGLLDYYSEYLLENVFDKENDAEVRDVVGSIFGLNERGNYSVVGVQIRGNQYSIPISLKSWDYELKLSLRDFIKAVRNGGDKLKKLLKREKVCKLIIDGEYEFLIAVF